MYSSYLEIINFKDVKISLPHPVLHIKIIFTVEFCDAIFHHLFPELQFPVTSNYGSMKKRSQRDSVANTTASTSVHSGEPSPTSNIMMMSLSEEQVCMPSNPQLISNDFNDFIYISSWNPEV